MSNRYLQRHPLFFCCLASIVAHVACVQAAGFFGRYDLGAPVGEPPAITVELSRVAEPAATAPPQLHPSEHAEPLRDPVAAPPSAQSMKTPASADAPPSDPAATPPASRPPLDKGGTGGIAVAADDADDSPDAEDHPAVASLAAAPAPSPDQPAEDDAEAAEPASGPQVKDTPATHPASPPATAPSAAAAVPPTMLKTVSDALSPRYEKLSYQISMHGIPIGNAELESKNDNGVTSIVLRVKSAAALSGIFPVNDVVETRHVGGRYIMTRISQQEGAFESEENFTINLRRRSVSWCDLKRPRSLTMTVPTDNVLDSLSGIYYLRKRPLQVGKTETLYIYDSETFAEVPVEVLRREEMSLPNLKRVATVVVRPLQKTAGIFRRTGELLIWMTDDDAKVPVKIETAVPLGKVTARLVSAESRRYPSR